MFTGVSFAAVKGIVRAPCAKPAMRPECRDDLLTAIAKARGWIDELRLGRIGSVAEIAKREAQGERHIRLLAPLAFLSPRVGDRPHAEFVASNPVPTLGRFLNDICSVFETVLRAQRRA